MAGILFTDGNLALAGFSQHKCCITGIGGKPKGTEALFQTAVRETIEELFELEEIPEALLALVCSSFKFDKLLCTSKYTTFVMPFSELDKLFLYLKMFDLKSKVYSVLPLNLMELLFTRVPSNSVELSHLVLIPCTYNVGLDKSLLHDIYAYKNVEKSL
jgi:hypothetical protein